jgi:hypothetical protein
MDVLALILTVAAMVMFLFAASGRELRRFNEIALGLVFLAAALICQFTSITNTHIGRLAWVARHGTRPPVTTIKRCGLLLLAAPTWAACAREN